jgi:hypothetical protein
MISYQKKKIKLGKNLERERLGVAKYRENCKIGRGREILEKNCKRLIKLC